MPAELIDGKKIADDIRAELKPRLAKLSADGVVPGLAAVLVGEDPGSQLYVKLKGKASEEMGMGHWTVNLPADVSETRLLQEVGRLNQDPKVHGILVQQPLPSQIRVEAAVSAVSPLKDVDCFHPVNVGLVLIGRPRFAPATPAGVVEMLMRSRNDPAGKDVVILGRSNIVGKPLAALLVQKAPRANATVTVAHSATKDIAAHTRRAEILIAAMGSPRFVKADMVRSGAVVIDVGINRVPDPATKTGFRTVGDVDFDAVREKAKAISPVPGGVGPMTIAMLLSNTVSAAELVAKSAARAPAASA
ncbi:MAG TPA: tetrahydrofolate dehydrogenase/cyclohydrolase catalytic domain-containing protein [Thermoplasmata archaeon]|nr:tetrahydrofolate dehydrogenase/cyclohydrolase catalytic domain-containing protein [Thermoplasmata archaeon]